MKETNLFIIGNPRSGTSLFRIMLSSHPEIIVPPECGFIQWWYDKYQNWNINNSNDLNQIGSFVEDLKTSRKIETWELDYKQLAELIERRKPENYSQLCTSVIIQYAHQKGKIPIVMGDKNNYYIAHLNLLLKIYPKAKFLILVRDCRDVVCSYLNVNNLDTNSPYKPKFSNEVATISKEWVANNELILTFLNQLNDSQYEIIRYEDLLRFPVQELKKCTNLLDVRFSNKMLDYYENQLEPSSLLDWKKKTTQKLDQSNIGKYVSQLSEEEINVIHQEAGSMLKRLNYF